MDFMKEYEKWLASPALSEAEQQSRDRKGGDGQHQRFAQFLELLQERGFFHVSTS